MRRILRDAFSHFRVRDTLLWSFSALAVLLSFLLGGEKDLLSLAASLVGVSALIFVAKGAVLGQLLTVLFSILYGAAALSFRYYGEMMTYLGMTAPMAILSAVSWLRNPFGKSGEVAVGRLTWRRLVLLSLATAAVTALFYLLLRALDTASLAVSTVSVTTSFLASALTLLRSPFYALAYAANDLVLIVLWITATLADPSQLPMVVCFSAFLANDLYGFCEWEKRRRRQQGEH